MKFHKKFKALAIENLFGAVFAAIGLFSSVFSVFTISSKLYEFGGASATLLFLIILLSTIIYAIIQYMEFNLAKSYKVSPEVNFLYKYVHQDWHINGDGSRDISCVREVIFFEKPKDDDCVDTVFGSLNLNPDDLNYNTEDAEIRHVIHARHDAINIYWKPKNGPIEIGEPYTHQFSCKYPAGTNAFEKSITLASLAYVGRMSLTVTSDNKINRITIKKNDDNIPFWDSAAIFDKNDNSYPTLVKCIEDNRLEIEIEKLEKGESYFVVMYLEQGV